MKKVLFAFLSVLLSASVAFAEVTVDGQQTAIAKTGDYSYSRSIWGWGNDWAQAGGTGFAQGDVITHGDGAWFAGQESFALATDKTRACTFALDFGTTSAAGAFVKTEGAALAGGKVLAPNAWTRGYYGDPGPGGAGYYQQREHPDMIIWSDHPRGEGWIFVGSHFGWNNGPINDYVLASSFVGGQVGQMNIAQEVGYYSGTGAIAMNQSGGEFVAGNFAGDAGRNGAFAVTGISGSIETGGNSFVTVDPYGHTQSAYGKTSNYVDVDVCGRPDFYYGNIGGTGLVATDAYAQNFGSAGYAGGISGFGYNGTTFGMGQAENYSVVNTGINGSSVYSYGSSSAFAR